MAGLTRRRGPALPAEVRRRLELPRGERVLAWAPLTDARWVVATTASLVVVRPDEAVVGRGWDQVVAAVWSETATLLQVTWLGPQAVQEAQTFELASEAGYLPEVVRERVEASVVISRRLDVSGRRGVRVALRRAHPGAPLVDQVVPDRGVRLSDPALAARVDAELDDLREQAGLPRLDSNQRPSD